MTKLSIIQQIITINSHQRLLKCIQPCNLDNREIICKNIEKIKSMKPFLPTSVYNSFSHIIEKEIAPIIDNPDYLSNIMTSEIGFLNDDGHFEFKGEYEFNLFFAKLCQLSINLEKNIQEWACTELSPLF